MLPLCYMHGDDIHFSLHYIVQSVVKGLMPIVTFNDFLIFRHFLYTVRNMHLYEMYNVWHVDRQYALIWWALWTGEVFYS